MAVICITYDLRKPGQAWPELDKAIEAMDLGGGRALQSCWFVGGAGTTPDVILAGLAGVLDGNDRIAVFTASRDMKVRGLSQAWIDWLTEHL